ncbi:peptide-methionine (S)-S-oxide reductase MsrA [Helicobacter turcicus]|uniref:Peptide methionine sulfoxide reductase MsrA n=1 Tax=Helicobacter turcicus TaxID=2867412 RepID=A0ABS7JP63_9HELI|nr:peptide-methionine (S)-S-oxide reductase MsrA [Helicobacter turcicus]MBX7491193.1 peptide-methionine (S)-S-oxide reductase MsrA [Helicobacter turcicus]MBX7546060.1 peptide-methionine (S)-S-oxide reductase MsrA [Helicobacter turcicus]
MQQTIYLAGGCFWGVQRYFDLLNGVISSQVGYANSKVESPNYHIVCSGITEAVEAVEIVFDSTLLSIHTLLKHFFNIIDPFALNYQGNDIGTQYRSGIYAKDSSLLLNVRDFIETLQKGLPKPIVTEVKILKNFYPAEAYHQKYLQKNPNGYCHINLNAIGEIN